MQPSMRRALVKAAIYTLVFLLVVIGLSHLYTRWSNQHYRQKTAELALPSPLKPPLAEDTAFVELTTLASQIALSDEDKRIVNSCAFPGKKEKGQACLQLLQRDDIKVGVTKFNRWLETNPHKLDTPSKQTAGHARVDSPRNMTDDGPDYFPLSKLVAIKRLQATVAFIDRRPSEALDHLRDIFALSSFLRDCGTLVSLLLSGAYENHALLLMIARLPASHVDRAIVMMPSKDDIVAATRHALGLETIISHSFFTDSDKIFDKNRSYKGGSVFDQLSSIWLFRSKAILNLIVLLPIYIPEHSNYLAAKHFTQLLDALDKRQIGLEQTEPITSAMWSKNGKIRLTSLFHNPLGRLFVTIISPNFNKYLAQIGRHLDRLEATKITLAAKRFRQKNGSWPTSFDQLLPDYITEIPISYLNGKTFMPIDDQRGITLYDLDGRNPATEKDDDYGWLSGTIQF